MSNGSRGLLMRLLLLVILIEPLIPTLRGPEGE